MTRHTRLLGNGPEDASLTPDATRRGILVAGAGLLLTGCANPPRSELPLLPGPAWTSKPAADPAPDMSASTEMHAPIDMTSKPPPPPPAAQQPAMLPTAISRRSWATGREVPRLMNRMTTVRYVTIHHDGMRPFFADDRRSAAARLDAIRRAHRDRNWGDIGYHYAVDRGGNVWECRPIRYQGAHVKNFNPGNIGVVALGNFDEQQPTQAQLASLHRHVSSLMRAYRVPSRNLRTHMQWAATRCPGRHVQRFIETGLSNGMFG